MVNPISICAVGSIAKKDRKKANNQSIALLYLLKVSSLVEVEEVVCYPGGDGEEGQLLLALLLGQGQGVEQLTDKEDPPGLFTTH